MKELLDQQSPKTNKMYKFTKNNPKFYSKPFKKKKKINEYSGMRIIFAQSIANWDIAEVHLLFI